MGEDAGEVGEQAGEVGEQAGEVGEQAGEVGEYAGEVGEYAGEVGESPTHPTLPTQPYVLRCGWCIFKMFFYIHILRSKHTHPPTHAYIQSCVREMIRRITKTLCGS